MKPITLYVILGLAVALVGSGFGHYVQHARLEACQAKAEQADAATNTAVDANESNQVAITTLRTELTNCQGEALYNATLQETARALAAEVKKLADQRQAEAKSRREAALRNSLACRDNAALPVCPDLIGAP